MNNYIIEATDYIVIQAKIKEILTKNNLSSDMIIKYDLLETPISNVILDLDTYNFLIDHKVVIANNAYFLTNSKPRNVINHNEEELAKYLQNANPLNTLILICDKIDPKKKIVKLFDKQHILSGEVNIDELIKEHLEDYHMDFKTTKYLINYCENDNERILSELDKLKCWKQESKIITIEDIDNALIKINSDTIFNLIDAIVLKNKQKAYTITNELVDRGEDISKIIIMVSDQFRLMYNVKELLKKGQKDAQIATLLNIHPYRVKLAIEKGYHYSSKDLLTNLERFFELDYMIKTGINSNPLLEFTLFLAKL